MWEMVHQHPSVSPFLPDHVSDIILIAFSTSDPTKNTSTSHTNFFSVGWEGTNSECQDFEVISCISEPIEHVNSVVTL